MYSQRVLFWYKQIGSSMVIQSVNAAFWWGATVGIVTVLFSLTASVFFTTTQCSAHDVF